MGGGRRPGVHRRRVHGEPRRGVRAARRQPRPQPALGPRGGLPARPPRARLALRRDAAKRRRQRPGRARMRLVRLRLPARREAVDLKTWLLDAHAAGARILVRARARRVVVESGVARGVEAETVDGHRVTVRARAVVAACGASTRPRCCAAPASRPADRTQSAPASGDRRLRPLRRRGPAVGGDDAGGLLRQAPRPRGRATASSTRPRPVHPSLFAAFAPWRSASQYRELAGGIRPGEPPSASSCATTARGMSAPAATASRAPGTRPPRPRTSATCGPASTAPPRSSRRPARERSCPPTRASSRTSPAGARAKRFPRRRRRVRLRRRALRLLLVPPDGQRTDGPARRRPPPAAPRVRPGRRETSSSPTARPSRPPRVSTR